MSSKSKQMAAAAQKSGSVVGAVEKKWQDLMSS